VCGRTDQLHDHHIFFGTANRKKSEEYGLKCWLCYEHHTGSQGVHFNPELDQKIKVVAQTYFEEHIGDRDVFRLEFGKSWL
jgi:hypothetical protein